MKPSSIRVIVIKAAKRLYLPRQLKRAGICYKDLRQFFCSPIRSILEYSCQLFCSCLPYYLSDEIESVKRRAMRIIFPDLRYSSALREAAITTLYYRREKLSHDLFKDIMFIRHIRLLLPKNTNCRHLKSLKTFNTSVCKRDLT